MFDECLAEDVLRQAWREVSELREQNARAREQITSAADRLRVAEEGFGVESRQLQTPTDVLGSPTDRTQESLSLRALAHDQQMELTTLKEENAALRTLLREQQVRISVLEQRCDEKQKQRDLSGPRRRLATWQHSLAGKEPCTEGVQPPHLLEGDADEERERLRRQLSDAQSLVESLRQELALEREASDRTREEQRRAQSACTTFAATGSASTALEGFQQEAVINTSSSMHNLDDGRGRQPVRRQVSAPDCARHEGVLSAEGQPVPLTSGRLAISVQDRAIPVRSAPVRSSHGIAKATLCGTPQPVCRTAPTLWHGAVANTLFAGAVPSRVTQSVRMAEFSRGLPVARFSSPSSPLSEEGSFGVTSPLSAP